MADPYVVHLHADLDRELTALEAAAERDPTGPEAKQYNAIWDGLDALAEGREAEFGGKRFHSIQEQYGELGDCAELKIPLVREFASNGYEFGPSHRLTYQEFEGTQEDPRPIRRAIAFEPRKDGRPFEVTAQRLGRAVGRPLPGLDAAKAAEAQRGGGGPAPVRMPLDTALAATIQAASNPAPASQAAVKPAEAPVATKTTAAHAERANERTQT
jgi:hypothetical protein